jgi:hypothetical protein
MTRLSLVAEAIDGAAVEAYLHGDVRCGDRLVLLATCVEHEGEYLHGVDRGLARVGRTRAPFLGALLADPDVRARRRALGLSVP